MFCKYCGRKMKGADTKCPYCGRERAPMQASIELKELLGGRVSAKRNSSSDQDSGMTSDDFVMPELRSFEKSDNDSGREESGIWLDAGEDKAKITELQKRVRRLERYVREQSRFLGILALLLLLSIFAFIIFGVAISGRIRKLNTSALEQKIELQEELIQELQDSVTKMEEEVELFSFEDSGGNSDVDDAWEPDTESRTEEKDRNEERESETECESETESETETEKETEAEGSKNSGTTESKNRESA